MIRTRTLLLTLAFAAYLGLASSSIVINEVELNPTGEGRIAESTPWVELYNTEYEEVDISGWSLSTLSGIETTIPSGTSVPAYGYYIVTQRMQWLMTANETLVLNDGQGRGVDRTPPLSDAKDDEFTWSRDPDGRDTDSTQDWKFLVSSRGF
jgi:hypothetical protein